MKLDADQINSLRDAFRVAMLDWDVPVSVVFDAEDKTADVSFDLWGTKFKGTFALVGREWQTLGDCPHVISDRLAAWQWIAMKLHEKLTA